MSIFTPKPAAAAPEPETKIAYQHLVYDLARKAEAETIREAMRRVLERKKAERP